jgi:hypothetical protein
MEKSPSQQDNDFSASQEILYVLCNPKDYYSVHKSPTGTRQITSTPFHTIYLTSILILSFNILTLTQ